MILLFLTTQLGASSTINQLQQQSNIQENTLENQLNSDIDEINNLFSSEGNTDTTNPEIEYYYEKQSFNFQQSDCLINHQNKSHAVITIKECDIFNQPELPILPMKTIQITLPLNSIIKDVILTDTTYETLEPFIDIQTAPKYYLWSVNETPFHTLTETLIDENIKQAQSNEQYPGITHTYITGKNKEYTKIIIHLFPIQYNLNTKEAVLTTQGTINVQYELKEDTESSTVTTETSAENIIITPLILYSQAKELKQFHESQGTKTIVVNTTWINNNYDESEYPPVEGYKDYILTQKIRKYDDKLARKIISFLQDQSSNSNLKFVTIFGNAKQVPPSYYFGEASYPVPTDFYYASPDLDLITNYHVGRLPVNSLFEAKKVVDKIKNWDPTSQQMDNIAIAGGIPFNTPFFIGELITTDAVNRGIYDGLNVDKFFKSDERFANTDVLSAMKGEHGLVYIICHGNSRLIACEDGRIDETRLQLTTKTTNTPIFSCIACSSGSYDTRIIKQGMSLDKTSFGEALLLSRGGGIAYIGGARTNDGYPIFTINKGRVEIYKETYMAGLLTYVSEAYQNDYTYLGELTSFAIEKYLEKNSMDDYWNQYHLYGFVLLGDPALQLPQRNKNQESFDLPQSSSSSPVGYKPVNGYGYDGSVLLQALDEITRIDSITNSPTVTIKQINTKNLHPPKVETDTLTTENGKAKITYTPTEGNLHLLRVETEDGKEDWFYYEPVRPVDDDFNPSTPGYEETRWTSIQQAIDRANPEDIIYVFNGTYYENIIVYESRNIIGEHWKNTIINGQGNDNVVSIYTDSCLLTQFTIEHCGNKPFDAGLSIIPTRSLKPGEIIITGNHITNNKNCGIYLSNPTQRFTPTISIIENSITNNNYGIYQTFNVQETNLIANYIDSNNYGIYIQESQLQNISRNTIENNYIGLFMNKVQDIEIFRNNFWNNNKDSQFSETTNTNFKNNYWDQWIGHTINLPIPKLINGYYTDEQEKITQIKFDRNPSKQPIP